MRNSSDENYQLLNHKKCYCKLCPYGNVLVVKRQPDFQLRYITLLVHILIYEKPTQISKSNFYFYFNNIFTIPIAGFEYTSGEYKGKHF